MFSLRNQAGRMAFLLQLSAGTISQQDIEAIAVQESTPYKRVRPVMVKGKQYSSITEAANYTLVQRLKFWQPMDPADPGEAHRAVNRIHKEIVRKIETGVSGYQYL